MTTLHIPPATSDFADQKRKLRVTLGINAALERSFVRYKMRKMTRTEVVRRFNLCFEGYRVMRNEMHWTIPRCLDYFDRILEADLTGRDMNFSNRAYWFGS